MRREIKFVFLILLCVFLSIGAAFFLGFQFSKQTAQAPQLKMIAGDSANTRTKTVEFYIGQYYGTGIASTTVTNYDFTVYLPDAISSATVVRSAYVEYNTLIDGSADASATDFQLGVVGSLTSLSAPDAIDQTGESTPVQMKLDSTTKLQSIIQAAGTFNLRFSTAMTGPVHYGENAKLKITYDYDDAAATQVKTVYAWVHSQAATVASTGTVTSANFNLGLPEASITSRSAWIETRGYVNAALTTDFEWNAESVHTNIAWLNTTNSYGYVALVAPSATYSPNVNNTFKMQSVTGAFSAPSAIVAYTYSFDYSASTELMNSLKIMVNQQIEEGATATLSGTEAINIPEAGITMKSCFLQGRAVNINTSTMTSGINAQLGSTPSTTAISFLANAGETTGFRTIIWNVTSNLSGMTAGDNTVYWAYATSAATNIRGLSLYLNYKYTKASSSSFNFQADYFVGQQTAASTTWSQAFTPTIADTSYTLKQSYLNYQSGENAATATTSTLGISSTGAHVSLSTGENVMDEIWRDTSADVSAMGSGLTATLNNNRSSTKSASFSVWWQSSAAVRINVTGSCYQYDQSTPCTDSGAEVIAVAVNGILQSQTDSTVDGSWSIANVVRPAANAEITVFINGEATASERATAVTKYNSGGAGDIGGIVLYQRHLTIGSDQNTTVSNSDMDDYDYNAGSDSDDADIIYDVDANNDLTVDNLGSYTDERLLVLASNTYQPDSNNSGNVTTHDFANSGTVTADGNTFNISGSWDNNAVFTALASTVTFTSTAAATETVDPVGSGASSFNNVTFGNAASSTTWTLSSALDINGDLTVSYGTLSMNSNHQINLAGALLINNSGNYTKDNTATAKFVFDGGAGKNLTSRGQDMGNIQLSTASTNITLQDALDVDNVTIDGSTTLTGNNQAVTCGGNWANSGDWTPGTQTVIFDKASSTQTLNAGTSFFSGLTHSGAGTLQLNTNAINIDGIFTNSNGTFDANDLNMNVADDFLISGGSFSAGATPGTQTTTFDGTNEATISGSTTFNHLTMNTTTDGAKTINFPIAVGNKQTIAGTWTLDGAVGKVLTLVSATPTTAWYFQIAAPFTAGDYIDVTDSWSADTNKITPGANTNDNGNNDGWIFASPNADPVNDSLTFTNPYTSNVAISDDTTEWSFEVKATDTDGPTDFDYVELHLANSTDSAQPYDSLKFRWTEATDTFSETADTQDSATLTSTGADSSSAADQWTLNFKIKINNSFLAKDTNYAAELYTIDDAAASDTDNYVNKFQVTTLSISINVDNASLNFGSLLPGSIVTGTTITTVTTNYPNGYSLGASDVVAGTNSTLLHTDTTTRIVDYAGTIGTPTAWTGTGLGITIWAASTPPEAKWCAATCSSEVDPDNKYAGVPETVTTIHTKVGAPTAGDTTSIGYKMIVPNTQKTGDYSGDITYTATGVLL